ncbi:NAD(P)-dependent alcohol dehydrogenase [Nocardia sp. CNY236]|uniref:NAD(P)-dependent alcohol dehydrogenase n=1 Tax=Nocardia sp. CNY236 TaxID=1169152 RepID=UPI0004207B1A|nr:NAD(P)-dependent alcohol dehydrogenase [Nocardia sp. CNY236]
MSTAAAYGVSSPDGSFEKITIERRDVAPHDVLIDIAYVGICHSDIHTARNEWGGSRYPCVPGHEITGVVAAVGTAVTKHRVGDRVGVGCMVDSCGECPPCRAGEEQHCTKGATMTYNGAVDSSVQPGGNTLGGYSTHVVVTENFVVRIPDEMGLDAAAPLLCAGITLYSPLRFWGAGPGKQVAIIGMGGLGHVGVKIAAAMGADVTVLSRSLSKQDDGKAFGASGYYATSDRETFRELRGRFDLMLNTVSANLPLDYYLRLLKMNGSLVILGLPEKPLTVSPFSLTGGRHSLAGSAIGGIAETQEMLDFCAEHKIGPEIELISADAIDDAYGRVVASDVRYRFVIDVSTM